MLVVRADSQGEVRDRLGHDPWYVHGILALPSVRWWGIFVDRWVGIGQ